MIKKSYALLHNITIRFNQYMINNKYIFCWLLKKYVDVYSHYLHDMELKALNYIFIKNEKNEETYLLW